MSQNLAVTDKKGNPKTICSKCKPFRKQLSMVQSHSFLGRWHFKMHAPQGGLNRCYYLSGSSMFPLKSLMKLPLPHALGKCNC